MSFHWTDDRETDDNEWARGWTVCRSIRRHNIPDRDTCKSLWPFVFGRLGLWPACFPREVSSTLWHLCWDRTGDYMSFDHVLLTFFWHYLDSCSSRFCTHFWRNTELCLLYFVSRQVVWELEPVNVTSLLCVCGRKVWVSVCLHALIVIYCIVEHQDMLTIHNG